MFYVTTEDRSWIMPSVAQMIVLGWGPGPGRPGSAEEAEWKRRNLRKALAVRTVKTLWVHKDTVAHQNALSLYLQRNGAKLGEKVDDWGFANRPVRGYASIWSYHKWALGVDRDATEHPLGLRHTTFADSKAEIAEVREVHKLLGMRWGYDYRERPDPMHSEVTVSRARARYIRSRLVKPTKRSKRLASLCGMPVGEFCQRIRASQPYPS